MDLHFRDFGKGDPLIILHGLYGSGDNWFSIGKKLEENNHVYLIDQRNHGKSPHHNEMNYNIMAEDLMVFACRQALQKINILGHSMGGKVAMTFSNKYPNMVNKLIVADISPRSYLGEMDANPQASFHRETVNALMALNLNSARTREEIDQELSGSIRSSSIRQFLLKNVTRSDQGKFIWKLNLEAIRNNLEDIFREVEILPSNPIDSFKVFFIKGELSNYMDDNDVQIISKYYNNFDIKTIPGTGHWLHAEKPDLFVKLINEFLYQ